MSNTRYVVEVSKEEALLLQKLRSIKFGSIKVHIVETKIIRTETTDSELMKEKESEPITISIETIIEDKKGY